MIHIDSHVGVSGAKIYWMQSADKKMWWCRQAVAIMGSFNMTEDEIATTSPFDPKFNDNYVEGKGYMKEEALEQMHKQMQEISDSLWAE